jgi:serine/threonine protein kinase
MAANEIQIARKHAAQTDHLVALMDVYFDEGSLFLLMEYCDGGSLEDTLTFAKEGVRGMPLGAITLQMLQGLRHMHREMKQVHRDLKPANVLLTGTGIVKVSDFGISKQLDATDAAAMTQVRVWQMEP